MMAAAAPASTVAPRAAGPNRDYVVQGEQRVTDDEDVVLSTILGSCVAACLRDPLAGVGGMNHFLLPGERDGLVPGLSASERMGVHAMEVLINALFARGANRLRLEAKVFGGACINASLARVGSQNAAFVTQFLHREGIAIVGECLGGRLGRRVQFWPVSGRARRSFLAASDVPLQAVPTGRPDLPDGALELF